MTRYGEPSKWSRRARIVKIFDELMIRGKFISQAYLAAMADSTPREVSACLIRYRRKEWAQFKHMKSQAYQWRGCFAPLYRAIFETMVRRGYSLSELGLISGVSYHALRRWTKRWEDLRPAHIIMLTAVLDLEVHGVRVEDKDDIEEYAKPSQPEDLEEKAAPPDRFDTPAANDGWADKRRQG